MVRDTVRIDERRLSRLVELCQLQPLAADVLACLVIYQHDPLGQYDGGGAGWLDVDTLADVLAVTPAELSRLLTAGSPLVCWGLVELDAAPPAVRASSRVGQFLVGEGARLMITRRAD